MQPEIPREAGGKKESAAIFIRRIGRTPPVEYQLTDRAPDRGSRDWQRVVAVFVTGAAWQFKGWPFRVRSQTNFRAFADTSISLLFSSFRRAGWPHEYIRPALREPTSDSSRKGLIKAIACTPSLPPLYYPWSLLVHMVQGMSSRGLTRETQ